MQKNIKKYLLLEQLEERIFLDANPIAAVDPVDPIADPTVVLIPINPLQVEPQDSVAGEPEPTPENSEQELAAEPDEAEEASSITASEAYVQSDSNKITDIIEVTAPDSNEKETTIESADNQNDEKTGQLSEPTSISGEPVANVLPSGEPDSHEDIRELVFVDSSVTDQDTLLHGVIEDISSNIAGTAETEDVENGNELAPLNGVQIITLDATQDEFQQISDTLSQHTDLEGIHILSHGSNSSFSLGATTLNSENLTEFSSILSHWGDALGEDGDLLLYGCNVGEDGTGVAFIQSIAELSGADVAASNDATGNSTFGGDWDLEVSTGSIDVDVLQDASGKWDGLLAPPDPIAGGSATNNEPMLNSQIGFSVTFDNDLNDDDADEGFNPYLDVVVPFAIDVQGEPTIYGSPASYYQTFNWNGSDWEDDSGTIVTDHPFNSNGVTLTIPTGINTGDTWYLIEPPFGSFVQGQPAVSVDFTADISTANGAVAGEDLDIVSRAGFRYGDTATNDNGPLEQATTHTTTITPRVIDIEKTNDAPEDQTVTGPNYPVEYTLTVNIANGETIDNVIVTDYLPENAVYRGDVAITAINDATVITPSPTREPDSFVVLGSNPTDRLLEINLGSLSGVDAPASATSEYVITYSVYFSDVDSSDDPLIDPATGDDETVMNESSIVGDYNGGTENAVDGTDSALGSLNDDSSDSITPSDNQIEIDSIAVYKSAANLNGGGTEIVAGDVIEWRIEVDISDYFGVGNVILNDEFGDGQTLIDGTNATHTDQLIPTLEIFENGVYTSSIGFNPANYTVGTESALNAAGDTSLQFRVSDQLATMGQDRYLDGGFFANGSVDGADQSGDSLNGRIGNDGTRIFIVYRTEVDQNYDKLHTTAGYSNDSSVDIGDRVSNDVEVSADIVESISDRTVIGSEADLSSATTTVPDGEVLKEIYAVNGNTAYDISQGVTTGDQVTYHLRMTLPTADFEELHVEDFLPLPAYDVLEVSSNSLNDFDGTVHYTGGEIEFGPLHNLTSDAIPGLEHNGSGVVVGSTPIAPILTVDQTNNSLILNFGSYSTDNPAANGTEAVIDILITVTIQNNPMVDELLLTNQGEWSLNDTNLSPTSQVEITPIKLNEPELYIVKGIVDTDNGNSTLGTAQGPVELTFNTDGSITVSGDPVEAQDLVDNPVDADLTNADGSDLVTFAITVYNTGGADAFDIHVTDTLPAGFLPPTEPMTPLNLRVYNGTGTLLTEGVSNDYSVIAGDFFTNGIDFHSTALESNPDDRGYAGGTDVFIITYQLQVDNETTVTPAIVSANSSHINEARVDFYTGQDDGTTNWTERLGEPIDMATVVIASPYVEKLLYSTEIVNGSSANDAVIGEEAEYQVTITLPEGFTQNAQLVDTLDPGLTFVALTGVASPSADLTSSLGTIDTSNIIASTSGQVVTVNLGDLTNENDDDTTAESITLTYTVFVNNTSGNQSDIVLDNSAAVSFTGGQSNLADAEDIIVIEPDLDVIKTVDVGGDGNATGDAGDSVEYTIILRHNGGSDTDAFDVTFSDDIPAQVESLSLDSVTDVNYGTETMLTTGNFTLTGNTLTLNSNIDMPRDRVITITVSGTLVASVNPSQTITNTGNVQWQSLDAIHSQDGSNERTGVDGVGGLNDYADSGSATITVTTVTVAKSLVDTEISDDAGTPDVIDEVGVNERLEAVIGEEITYEVVITAPESTMSEATLVDILGGGLSIQRIDDVTATGDLVTDLGGGFGSVSYTTTGTGATGDPQTVTFDLGTLSNGDDNLGLESVTLRYTVLVLNDDGNTDGQTVNNSAQFNFTGGNSNRDSAEEVTIIEPDLDVTKTVDVGGDGNATGDAGDTVEYTIILRHNGGSDTDAFDVTFSDDIPAQVESLSLDSVTDVNYGTETMLTTGNFTLTGNTLTLNSNIDMPRDRVITITVSGTLAASVNPSQTITNTGNVQWQSLDAIHSQDGSNERTGVDGVGGLNDYADSGSATITVTTVTVAKSLVDTEISDDAGTPDVIDEVGVNERLEAVIGEEITYEVVITAPESTMSEATLVDILGDGLSIQRIDDVTATGDLVTDLGGGFGSVSYTTTGTGATGDPQTVTFDLGTLSNGDDNLGLESVTLRYTVLVLNDDGNTDGQTVNNSAQFNFTGGNSNRDSAEEVTIIEPIISTEKTINGVPDPGEATVEIGDILTYTVVLTNTGNAAAYEVTALDTLAPGTRYYTDGTHTPSASAGGITITDNTNGNGLDDGTIAISSGTDGWDLVEDDSVTITYYALVEADYFDSTYGTTAANLINTVDADWSSNDDTTSLTTSGLDRVYDDGANGNNYTVDGTQDDDPAVFNLNYNGSIGDTVFFDSLGDGGIFNSGEGDVGISGVDVTLSADLDGDGSSDFTRTMRTDTDGHYLFDDLAAFDSYVITVDAATSGGVNPTDLTALGYAASFDLDGIGVGSANVSSVSLTAGQNRTDVDFGYTGQNTVGDTLWFDADNDGVQDADEGGLNGLVVDLRADIDGDGTTDYTARTTTQRIGGIDGQYTFEHLPAGDYEIEVTPLAASVQTYDYDDGLGATDNQADFSLGAIEDNLDIDFGYRGTGSIGDFVWFDVDADAAQNDGVNSGLAGVDLTLSGDFDGDGNIDYTETIQTADDGSYLFDHLMAGTYSITVDDDSLPSGTSNWVQTFDLDEGATPPALDNIATDIALTPGEDRDDVDFGYRGTGSLGDTVWYDSNANGIQDGTELGIAGVEVQITADVDGDGVYEYTDTAMTDANGNYSFSYLPAADYITTVNTTTLPAGQEQTYDKDDGLTPFTSPDSDTTTLGIGEDTVLVDYGYRGTGSIGDYVWYDMDGDGIQDEGVSSGMGGIRVTISGDIDNDGIDDYSHEVTTADNGSYLFDNLFAGDYTVTVNDTDLPDGMVQSFDYDDTVGPFLTAHAAAVTLAAGEDNAAVDFGYTGTGSIGDTVFFDADNSGGETAGDVGISGVDVTLTADIDGDGVSEYTETVRTDADGLYLFSNLAAFDDYVITVDAATSGGLNPTDLTASGYIQTYDVDEGVSALDHTATSISLVAAENRTDIDFGYTGQNTVGDTVWFDADNDGVQDTDEGGLNGLTVTLRADIDGDGSFEYEATTTTQRVAGIDGQYSFDHLPAGDYEIEVTPLAASVQTYDYDDGLGATDNQADFSLGAIEDNLDIDFGYRGTGSIGDFVWFDADADAAQNDGVNSGLAGVDLILRGDFDGDGNIDYTETIQTADDGSYLFDHLMAGTYSITVDDDSLPSGTSNWVQTFDLDEGATPPALDNIATDIALTPGEDRDDVDFGYRGTGSLGDTVWYDSNANGIQDGTELGIAGVEVQITADVDGDGVYEYTDTAMTDANGNYSFSYLPAADYITTVNTTTLPAGQEQTYDKDDGLTPFTSPDSDTTTLGIGEDTVLVDFGYRGTGSIGDYVWYDMDGDGIQDEGVSSGMGGIRVTISGDIDNDGIDDYSHEVTTADNGSYLFDNLFAGDYTVTVNDTDLPDGMVQSFDYDDTVGPFLTAHAAAVTLAAGEDNAAVDFGYTGTGSIGDTVFFDADNSGGETAGDVGISGVDVTLTADIDGDGVSEYTETVRTDADGLYLFSNLAAFDDYVITVDAATSGGLNPTDLTASGYIQTYDVDEGVSALDHTATSISLVAAENRTDIDFGYTGQNTVGDTVWFDADNDGVQDTDEGGLNGLTVTLRADIDGDGSFEYEATTTTQRVAGIDGQYSFDHLPAGDYEIEVTPLAASVQTYDYDDGLGATDNQADFSLGAIEDNLDIDFGYRGTGSIGDFVWFDADADAAQNDGVNSGLAGVDLILRGDFDGDGNIDYSETIQTADDGSYSFDYLLGGTYTITVDDTTLPAGLSQTADPDAIADNTTIVSLADGESDLDQDFGYTGLNSAGDTVWFDFNNNGIQDTGEDGIGNVDVTINADIDDDDIIEYTSTATTDGNGFYTFTNLPGGDYTISVDPTSMPPGAVQTYDLDDGFGASNNQASFTMDGASDRDDVDFGYRGTGSLGDFVWYDADFDGIQNDGPLSGLESVTVLLAGDIDGDTTIDFTTTVTTGADGSYSFDNLLGGSYTISIDSSTLPGGSANWSQTFDLDDATGPFATPDSAEATELGINGADLNRTDVDFGYTGNSSIGDTVFFDTDQSGSETPGDTGITDILVTLSADTDGDGAPDFTWTDVTDADGLYLFENLPAFDNYTVTLDPVNLPDDTEATYDLDGVATEHVISGIVLGVAEDREDVDFGYFNSGSGSIGDTVWYDADADGVLDASEQGLGGVQLTLTGDITGDDVGDISLTTTTDENGNYTFGDLLPGNYTVTVDSTPDGMEQTFDLDGLGTPDAAFIPLADGENNNNVDFGYTGAASVGDIIYFDSEGDGPGGTDIGLPGVVVSLSGDVNNDGIEDSLTTVTDENGHYLFENLRDGAYTITVDPDTLPTGMDPTADPDGGDDNTSIAAVVGGVDVLDQDFGYTGTGSIGDTIWEDADGNGVQNGTEPGLIGVDVTLSVDFDGDGTADYTGTVTTDGNGNYSFDNLPAGTYTIAVDTDDIPGGYVLTGDPDSNPDSTSTVNLPTGGTNLDQDFGYQNIGGFTGSIGDTIFFDADGDGTQAGGEPGISGVTVTLTGDVDGDGTPDTVNTTTDANGNYLFDNLLADDYTILVNPATLPAGMNQTADPDGVTDNTSLVTLVDADILDQDFGYNGTGSIGDTIFFDGNNNGTQDSNEGGINGVGVNLSLDLNGDGIVDYTDSSTTNSDGTYLFENLPAGEYTISVAPSTLPTGMIQSSDPDSSLDDMTTYSLAGGENNLNQDFGYTGTGSIGDTIWNDTDGNGIQESGEGGLAGVEVTVSADIDSDGIPDFEETVATDGNGNYIFENLPEGEYTITVDPDTLPTGFDPNGIDPDGDMDNSSTIDLTAGEDNLDQDFGYNSGTGSIGDTIFFDIDGSGAQNGTEPGLPGVTVSLSGDVDGDGTPDTITTVTDSSGDYLFDALPAGDYTITVDTATLPAGMTQTADPDVDNDDTSEVTLAADEDNLDQDFGYQGNGSIGDTIWDDENGDGLQNDTAGGLSGVDVTLSVDFDGNGTIDYTQTETTDSEGNYLFDNLPAGDYTVSVDTSDIPDEYVLTSDPDGNPDSTTDLILAADEDNLDQDFGYSDNDSPTGSIGDTIYFDENNNDTQDGSDVGLPGVTVTLDGDIDGDGSPDRVSTVTDSSGSYLFDNLPAGDYTVTVDPDSLPAGMSQTEDPDADVNNSSTVTLGAGDDNDLQDFGYTGSSVIGDTIYFDTNGNGIQDGVENGLPGVAISISVDFDGDGTPDYTATETTDGNGNYSFDNLPGGNYTLSVDTTSLPGDVRPSGDPDSTLDNTSSVVLGPSETNNDQDFGYTGTGSIGDTVYYDADGNGFQSPGERGLGGVTVTLQGDFDNDGTIEAVTTTTDGNGTYLFENLTTGVYTVYIDTTTLPGGLTQTGDPDATLDNQSTVTLSAGETNLAQDFGYSGPSPFPPPLPPQPGLPLIPVTPTSPQPSPVPSAPADQGLVADAFFMYRQFGDRIDTEIFNQEEMLPWQPPILPVSPMYTGHTEPGTTIQLVLFDALGNQIGYESVMADTAGNWMADFPETIMYELPHRMEIVQTISSYNASSAGFFNMRTYFAPSFSSMIYSHTRLDVDAVFAYMPSTVIESVHHSNLSPFDVTWNDFNGYEFFAPSTNPAQDSH